VEYRRFGRDQFYLLRICLPLISPFITVTNYLPEPIRSKSLNICPLRSSKSPTAYTWHPLCWLPKPWRPPSTPALKSELPMAPSISPTSTHYALVIDAGSSGSRLQIYSWRDPDLERAEILQEVEEARKGRGGRKWWVGGKDGYKWKGKGKERYGEMERSALRRLVRVGKGVEGEAWVKRAEPGECGFRGSHVGRHQGPSRTRAE